MILFLEEMRVEKRKANPLSLKYRPRLRCENTNPPFSFMSKVQETREFLHTEVSMRSTEVCLYV